MLLTKLQPVAAKLARQGLEQRGHILLLLSLQLCSSRLLDGQEHTRIWEAYLCMDELDEFGRLCSHHHGYIAP